MKKIALSTVFIVYENTQELPEEIAKLMKGAVLSREKAYAPYSKFQVGAAILLENGEVIFGNNQENAAFPSGLCAERVAVTQAGAVHPGVAIKAIAITAATSLRKVAEPVPPCGACRQVLSEYEYRQKSPIPIYFMGDDTEVYLVSSVAELLPMVFTQESLSDN